MKSLTKSKKQKLAAVGDAQVELALPVVGVLNDVRSAFFGLCVNAGKAVLTAMMEEERAALCGAKGVPNPTRSAYRGGHTRSQVTLAGQRIAIARPRARHLARGEVTLPSFEWATHRDPLDAATMTAIAAGVSTRRYGTTLDPLPADESAAAVSKSAVSRRFVALSSERLEQWLASRLDHVRLPVVMIDGIHFKDRVVLVALGFDTDAGLLTSADAVMSLTTRNHTMLRAAYEAIYQGTPVIVSDWPLLRSAFDEGAVHVENTSSAVAEGIRKMERDHAAYRAGAVRLQERKLERWTATLAELRAAVAA